MLLILPRHWRWRHWHTSSLHHWGCSQRCTYSINRRGLSRQPWGAPVFSTRVKEVWLLVQIICLWGSPISSCRMCYLSPVCWVFQSFSRGRFNECWAETLKSLDLGVISKVIEDWGSRLSGMLSWMRWRTSSFWHSVRVRVSDTVPKTRCITLISC